MSRRLEGDPVQATHHESTNSWLLRHKYSEGKSECLSTYLFFYACASAYIKS